MNEVGDMTEEDFLVFKGGLKGAMKRKVESHRGLCTLIKQEKYTLLSEYLGVKHKIHVKCSNNHDYWVVAASFKRGARCTSCTGRSTEFAKENFLRNLNAEGYSLVSEFKKVSSKVQVSCPNNHTYTIFPTKFNLGGRCAECQGKTQASAEKRFLSILNERGYCVAGYKDSKTKVLLSCYYGHSWSTSPHNLTDCPRCYPNLGRYSWKSINSTLPSVNKVEGVYLIKIKHKVKDETFYKIGMDCLKSKNTTRHGRNVGNYTISLSFKGFYPLYEAFTLEQSLLSYVSSLGCTYTPKERLTTKGNGECFTLDGLYVDEGLYRQHFENIAKGYNGGDVLYNPVIINKIKEILYD